MNTPWIPLICIKQIMFCLFMFVCQQSDQVLFGGTLWYSSATPNPKHLQKNLFPAPNQPKLKLAHNKTSVSNLKIVRPPNRNHPFLPTSFHFVGKCRNKHDTSSPPKKNCNPWLWPPGGDLGCPSPALRPGWPIRFDVSNSWNFEEFQNMSYLEDHSSYPLVVPNIAGWNIPMFNRKYIFKWWISHCYVSYPNKFIPPGKDRWLATPISLGKPHGPLLIHLFGGGSPSTFKTGVVSG